MMINDLIQSIPTPLKYSPSPISAHYPLKKPTINLDPSKLWISVLMIFHLPGNLITELSTKDNGQQIMRSKDLVDKYGLMAPSMRGCGIKTWQTAKAGLFIPEEMYIRANGSMIRLREKVSISIKMVLHILVNGWMTNSMAMVWRNGLMVLNMRDTSTRG
jgi:hypothetical protein